MTIKKKKTTKKTRRKTVKKRHLSQNMRILLATVFLLGFVAICLFALVRLQAVFLPGPVTNHKELVYEEPADVVHHLKIYSYTDIRTVIENQLMNGPLSSGWRKLPDRKNVQVREIFGDFPSAPFLTELENHLEQANRLAKLKVSRDKGTIDLYWQGVLQLELQYQVPKIVKVRRGKIAIIMDDIGRSLSPLKKLQKLDIIITPSILPGTGKALSATSLLRDEGHEYMIHMPMQPRSYPKTNPGENALLLGQSEGKTRRLIQSYIESVPGAIGCNNHMGSRYTEDKAAMRIVLDELKKYNFFFIDSRTIGDSIAFSEARKMGLKTATRNIFLDNKESIPAIRKQIRRMVSLAGKNKEIIAICHPYSETLEAFRLEQDWLKRQKVDFVAASDLVHAY
jgi:polysaccharide deacetylase 2 family uncharacterized protein YibQ